VIDRTKPHYASIRLSVLLVMLGTCVFFWGLAYKLSLYDTQGPTLHSIPEAKLLSRNEDPNATDSLRLCLAGTDASQVGLIFCTLLLLLLGTARTIRSVSPGTAPDLPRPQFRFILSALFFRPPPIHSVL